MPHYEIKLFNVSEIALQKVLVTYLSLKAPVKSHKIYGKYF